MTNRKGLDRQVDIITGRGLGRRGKESWGRWSRRKLQFGSTARDRIAETNESKKGKYGEERYTGRRGEGDKERDWEGIRDCKVYDKEVYDNGELNEGRGKRVGKISGSK